MWHESINHAGEFLLLRLAVRVCDRVCWEAMRHQQIEAPVQTARIMRRLESVSAPCSQRRAGAGHTHRPCVPPPQLSFMLVWSAYPSMSLKTFCSRGSHPFNDRRLKYFGGVGGLHIDCWDSFCFFQLRSECMNIRVHR